MNSYNLLDEPIIWQTLMARCNGHAAHDAAVIAEFCLHCNVPAKDVLAKMRTHCKPASTTRH